MEVTVAVATFGDPRWERLAEQRAIPSARPEAPVVHVHGDTLHEARNEALARVETPWVIHLDADDELVPGYVDALSGGQSDVRAPSVSYVRKFHKPRPAGMPRVAGHKHDCTGECLPEGNWLVIGSAVRTDLVREIGGWEPWPLYEDWAMWLRCWLAGATVEAVPEAVYRAHVNFESRNRAPNVRFKNKVHHEIADAILPQVAA